MVRKEVAEHQSRAEHSEGGWGGINGNGQALVGGTAPVGDGCTVSLVAASRQALQLCQPQTSSTDGADDIRTSNVDDWLFFWSTVRASFASTACKSARPVASGLCSSQLTLLGLQPPVELVELFVQVNYSVTRQRKKERKKQKQREKTR